MDLGDAHLEPSLDRICAFHINPRGPHSLSTFWEYENEVKADSLEAKLHGLHRLKEFDVALARRFKLKPERLDKYRRCASCFLPAATLNSGEKTARTEKSFAGAAPRF
ncbi:MAG: hypothetical protein HY552_05465 [Elusimicrobia bacterium]|nr:hypothetical protein [Elusimicrobiota bacterium]